MSIVKAFLQDHPSGTYRALHIDSSILMKDIIRGDLGVEGMRHYFKGQMRAIGQGATKLRRRDCKAACLLCTSAGTPLCVH